MCLIYPQYLVMLVLWEKDGQTVTQIGEKLNLDSGTLTPLLKRLEQKKIIVRARSERDERNVVISLTASGESLKEKACQVPAQIVGSLSISVEELQELKGIIDQILSNTIQMWPVSASKLN